MARPKPIVLLEAVNKHTFNAEQVLKCDSIYIVVFQNKPINLRSLNTLVSYPGPKYKKVSFSTKASADNLANRLNKLFNTTEFGVAEFNGSNYS